MSRPLLLPRTGPLLLAFLCTASGSAQHIVYDAGSAGNPPTAPDPQAAGWSLHSWNGQVGLNPISPDAGTGLNAWEVADNTTSGRAVYEANFSPPTYFVFTATLRMTAGPSNTIFLEYQDGFTLTDCRFRVLFRVVGNDVIATDGFGSLGTPEMTCPGAAGTYHTFAIRFIPSSYQVEFVYDGLVLGPLTGGIAVPGTNEAARWGAISDAGLGRARFHRVEFQALPEPISTPRFCGGTVPNSTGSWAYMLGFGSMQIGGPGFTLEAYGLPPGQFGYFLLSPQLRPPPGFIPPGSQGRMCLGPGSIGRFNRPGEVLSSGASGSFVLDVDTLDVPTNPPGALPHGEMFFQGWYRDTHPGATSNFTTAVRIFFL